MSGAERIAKGFYDAAQRLAPAHGLDSREESWEQISAEERELLVAVFEALLAQGDVEYGVLADAAGDKPRAHFEIYPSGDEFRWRLRAINGEILASGEGFDTDYNAERACADLVRNAMWTRGIVSGHGFSINVEHTEA